MKIAMEMKMAVILTLGKNDTGFDPAYQTELDAIGRVLEDFEVIVDDFCFAGLEAALRTQRDGFDLFLVVRHGWRWMILKTRDVLLLVEQGLSSKRYVDDGPR
jgi:hypothetical protein